MPFRLARSHGIRPSAGTWVCRNIPFSDTAVSNNKIPYYMANRLLWKWARCEGIDGCEIVRETKLSMDQAPPPLPAPPNPPGGPSSA